MADKATITLADLIGELKTRDAAVASNEGKVASALGDLLADGVAAKVAMGETITAIMANLGGDKAPVSQRAALAAVAAKPYSFVCSQTRWTQSVRAFTQVGTLTAKQMTADLKLYRTYAVSVNENPTVLGYLNWEKGDKAPPTLTELRDKRDEALDKATALLDLSMLDDEDLKTLRSVLRTETAYRAKLAPKAKADLDNQIKLNKAKGKGKAKSNA